MAPENDSIGNNFGISKRHDIIGSNSRNFNLRFNKTNRSSKLLLSFSIVYVYSSRDLQE